jgi:crotonobetainyl-CoA:carnitine CoA-transferase CaiB-like acyl-CoA transferase
LYFLSLNWGKRSFAVRLGCPEGRQLMLDLIKVADAVIDNYRPQVLARLGLDHEVLAEVNPRIVTCSLTGFGESGAYSKRPGFDYTIQATAGVMSLTGEPGGPPGKAGISYVDHAGGLAASLAVCTALLERERTGRGRHIDLGLMDTQISMLTYLASWHLNAGAQVERTANASHPSMVPAQNFETKDGWISLFVGNDNNWRQLTAAINDKRLFETGYLTNSGRFERKDELLALLRELIRTRSTDEWVTQLVSLNIPCAPVNSLGEALESPPVLDRDLIQTAHNSYYRPYQHVSGPVPAIGDRGGRGAPVLGEHTVEILADIGHPRSTVTRLIEAGIVTAVQSSLPVTPVVDG